MANRTRLFCIALAGAMLCAPRAFAQGLNYGVIGGAALTDAAAGREHGMTKYWSESKDAVAGVMLEFRWGPRFSVEANGLYRELHANSAIVSHTLADSSTRYIRATPAVTWQFPVLAKYRFRTALLRPFVEAGPSFRTGGTFEVMPSHRGVTAGFGLETYWGALSISPVVRYTRWQPSLSAYWENQANQVEMLVGIGRAPRGQWLPRESRFSAGITAGWALSRDYRTSSTSIPVILAQTQLNGTSSVVGERSMVVGPSLEYSLLPHLSLEAAALYKPIRSSGSLSIPALNYFSSSENTITSWQFPVLAKGRLGAGRTALFAEAGPSFRLARRNVSSRGFTSGGGVELRAGILRFAPELRYTRWASPTPIQNETMLLMTVSLAGGGPKK
jgi:hypothetical protein